MARTKVDDILTLIEADHRKVEELFAQIETAKGTKKSQQIFEQIYKELNLHALAEELVFYPAMQEYEQTKQYIEEAEEEHTAAKILLEQMKSLDSTDVEFKTKLQHLQEAIMHHVEEEESEIFNAVRECIEEEQLVVLAQEFLSAKTKVEADVEAALA